MGAKKAVQRTNVIVVAVLLAGILAVVNAFFYRHFIRIDLTENKKYTISDSTRKILKNLDDIVNIKIYLSKKLPPYMVTITDQIKDVLEEYTICAEGNLEIEYIDPGDDPGTQQKLRFMGIPQLRLNIIEKDQAAVTDVYMGLAVLYGDNKEVIPALTELETFEYDLTSRILRVTASEVQSIGFLSGHGEPELQQGFQIINEDLRSQFFTRTVSTSGGEKIPEDIAALVVASPGPLSQRDLFEIDQYLMSGGKVIFLVNAIDIEARGMRGTASKSNVFGLVKHYGVMVQPELVLDQLNANASFQSGMFNVMVPYPFWVRVVRESIEGDHPVISSLESMVFPWASPLEVVPENTKNKIVDNLAQTTQNAWTQQGYFDLSPRQEFAPAPDQLGKRLLAVAVSGRFDSYFAGKSVPPVEESAAGPEAAEAPAEKSADESRSIVAQSPETKVIVVGSSRFVTDQYPAEFDGNRIFFLNVIDWVILGDQLIDIRSRETGERPLRLVSDKTRTIVRAVNLLGVPVLLAAFGLVQFLVRRRRKRSGTREV